MTAPSASLLSRLRRLVATAPDEDGEMDETTQTLPEFGEVYYAAHPDAPVLEPARSALFCGGPWRRHKREFSAGQLARRVEEQYRQLLAQGMDTFIVDYVTPYGMFALKQLLKARKKGVRFRLYAVRTAEEEYRESSRLVRESLAEVALLLEQCDYLFAWDSDDDMGDFILYRVDAQVSEDGIEFYQSGTPDD